MRVFKDDQFSKACGDDVTYGFYGRSGGCSEGLYATLNCSYASQDDQKNIAKNRSIIAQHMGCNTQEISTVWQCHSALCLLIDKPITAGDDTLKADALVTDKPGVPIGVMTADCGPVLFVAKKVDGSPVIGAAHAGWGGALGGVLEETVAKMIRAGAEILSVKAVVGPCIMQASYEVSEDFMRPFAIKHEEAEHFFKAAREPGHLMFDLPGYIAMRLAFAGVKQVSIMGNDTYRDEESLFSFRRSTHKGEADYGRQMSAIVING